MNTDGSQTRVPMSSPDLNEEDLDAVLEVMRSGRLAMGPRCAEFEQLLARYVGVPHAIAVNSGTSALHLIVRAMGLGPGDEALVPSFTFAASVNALLYEGVIPVFVDIDPETYTMDPTDAEKRITTRTKAIMAVDVFGHSVEWNSISALADSANLFVIDDSCEALGARYNGQMVGTFGDAAAFAFYPNKQMTTGEGGMVVTSDERIAWLVRSMSNQGREAGGAWLDHARIGFNYRLDEMSAALGCTQIKRIDQFLAKRDRVAQAYTKRLAGLRGVRPPIVRSHVRMSWFVYVVTLEEGIDGRKVVIELEKRGIPARVYFTPVHLQPYVQSWVPRITTSLPVTESVAGRTIALPFYNDLSEDSIDLVVNGLAVALRAASRPHHWK